MADLPILPQIVTSIQPIAAIIYPLCDGVCQVQNLQGAQQSAHDFHLSPQHLKQLDTADVVLWFDEHLEGHAFQKIALAQAHHATLIHIKTLPLSWRAARQLKIWGDTEQSIDHHHGHSHGAIDPHFWLDPSVSAELVQHVSHQLQARWPEKTSLIKENTHRWLAQLAQLDQNIDEALSPIKHVPFLVFHDAYQYFEQRYHLNTRGVVQLNPNLPDSAKSRWDVKTQLAQENIHHIFLEPQLNGKWLTQLKGIHLGQLDPLGAHLTLNEDTYHDLLMTMVNELRAALSNSKTDHAQY